MSAVPLDQLYLESLDFKNPRHETGLDNESIRQLAEDINRRGLLNPLLVWQIEDDCYIVIGGQRRLRAYRWLVNQGRLAEDHPVDVHVMPGMTAQEACATAFADNVHRENLSTYEQAKALVAMNLPYDECALRVGLSTTHVRRLCETLNHATPALAEAWQEGAVSARDAERMARLIPEEQELAVKGDEPITPKPRAKQHREAQIMADGKKKRGPTSTTGRGRPTLANLKILLKKLPDPVDEYQEGVIHTLRYVVEGQLSTSPSWTSFISGTVSHGDLDRDAD